MQNNTILQNIQAHVPGLAQLLTISDVCGLLRKSRGGLYRLMDTDPAFPRPLKDGEARSARAFFVASEIASWQQNKLQARAA
ncbi:transcriptional regulator [Pseudomonas sp. WS 5051]|uniref:helix-turn-helix transcriptional regulator n=1 Tax=Pseudomonas sp. WS 5051 TaxID=2717482 RepID=UPI001473AB73|nr:transcriptional regulator [Pseudomonas sp. WS 5051]NMY56886.1 transcriptional regulator [Pseudomonas sp. WS 5051]